jgi:hypothetical protein
MREHHLTQIGLAFPVIQNATSTQDQEIEPLDLRPCLVAPQFPNRDDMFDGVPPTRVVFIS